MKLLKDVMKDNNHIVIYGIEQKTEEEIKKEMEKIRPYFQKLLTEQYLKNVNIK